MKPSNLVIGYDDSIKIIDLDSVKGMRYVNQQKPPLLGTFTYRARDYHSGCRWEGQTTASDVFSLGVIIIEVYMKRTMYSVIRDTLRNGRPAPRRLYHILQEKIKEFVQPEVQGLVSRMTSMDTNNRPGVEDIVKLLKTVTLRRVLPEAFRRRH